MDDSRLEGENNSVCRKRQGYDFLGLLMTDTEKKK